MIRVSVLFLLLMWTQSAFSHMHQLVACIDDHPPYQYVGPVPYGIHISALHKLSDVLEREIKFVQSPNFARCVALLKKGEVDVIAGLNPTPERSAFAFYAPFKSADALKVISKKDITIRNYDDFKGKIIGVARGSTYFPRFDNDDSLNKITIQNNRIGFSLLLKERIDFFMVSPVVLDTMSTEINAANLKVSPMSLAELRNKETFFGFSEQNKLNIEKDKLIDIVTTAYKNGRFK